MTQQHDFVKFPELTNSQMDTLYFQSPHRQILEDFDATIVKVIDGDTVRVITSFRNFDFPVRMLDTNAPEMSEDRGEEIQSWLENLILNRQVRILIKREKRVGKYGRLLGIIMFGGINLNEESIRSGRATPFENRNEGKIPDFTKEMNKIWH